MKQTRLHIHARFIFVYFICSKKKTIHSYKCFCDPEDILLIYSDVNITLPKNLLFLEIDTHVTNKYQCP